MSPLRSHNNNNFMLQLTFLVETLQCRKCPAPSVPLPPSPSMMLVEVEAQHHILQSMLKKSRVSLQSWLLLLAEALLYAALNPFSARPHLFVLMFWFRPLYLFSLLSVLYLLDWSFLVFACAFTAAAAQEKLAVSSTSTSITSLCKRWATNQCLLLLLLPLELSMPLPQLECKLTLQPPTLQLIPTFNRSSLLAYVCCKLYLLIRQTTRVLLLQTKGRGEEEKKQTKLSNALRWCAKADKGLFIGCTFI